MPDLADPTNADPANADSATATSPGAEPPDTSQSESRSAATPSLSGEQLGAILKLLPEVDSVEIKLTVAGADRRSVIRSLGVDPLKAQIRQVMFFDTPDLELSSHGVVLRARRIQRRAGDAVVKLRPVEPSRLPPELRKLKNFGVEVDTMPGGFVCSGTLKTQVPDRALVATAAGETPISRILSKAQRTLFAEHAPGFVLNDLRLLGPITLLKLKFSAPDHPRPMVAELWFYPDGSQILELSTKCLPAETFQAVAEGKAFLTSKGVDLGAPQQTKTRAALDFFSRELRQTL